MGPLASAALPALNKLLQVKERYLREAAELAVSQIVGHVPDVPLDQAIAANTIDFVRTKTAVMEMLLQGLAKFAGENPEVEVSTVGLFGFGFGQCVSLCLETPEHSAKSLEQSPDLAQKDKFGQFFISIYDFAYSEYASDGFEWWPSLYEIGQDFRILLPGGKTVRRSTNTGGNNAIDVPFFKLLQEILSEIPITGIRRAKPLRLGVQMANSDLVKFWVAKQ